MKHPIRTKSSRLWLAGSAAVGASLIPDAHAGNVQIILGTEATSEGPNFTTNTLDPDLTGDGNDDMGSFDAFLNEGFINPGVTLRVRSSVLFTFARAGYSSGAPGNFFAAADTGPVQTATSPLEITDFVPVSFTDARINGGVETSALLEVTAKNNTPSSHTVTLVRLIFDDASTARPTGVMTGDMIPDWVDPAIALRAAERQRLQKRIRALTKKLRRARRAKQQAKIKRLSRQLRKFRRQLRAL